MLGFPLLAILLVANLVSLLLDAPAGISTTILLASVLTAVFFTLDANRGFRVPPLLDIGFLLSVIVYFVFPVAAPLFSDVELVRTWPLQQALIGSCVCVFTLTRFLARWRHFRRMVINVERRITSIERHHLVILFILCSVWLVVALYFIRGQFLTPYGMRAPGQRNPLTIVLLGFDYFGITLAAVLLMWVARDFSTRKILYSALALTAFGFLTFAVFSVRTKFFWGLSLASLILLMGYRLTVRRLVIVSLSFVLMVPFLAFTSRARTELHTGDWSILRESLAQTMSLSLGEMFAGSEPSGMAILADDIIETFGDERLYGRYVGLAILQSPPSFVLRVFGFDELMSFAGQYVRYRAPRVFDDGGGMGLSLAAESYCNFGVLGGVFSGFVLALFCTFIELLAARFTPPWLGLSIVATFLTTVARASRGGLEMMPKVMFVLAVIVALYQIVRLLSQRRSTLTRMPGARA